MRDEQLVALFERLVPEPPRSLPLVQPALTRRRSPSARWQILASTAAVVLLVLGVGWVVRPASTDSPPIATAEDCPATIKQDLQVKVPGLSSIEGTGTSLVPAKPALSAFVCRYTTRGELVGQRPMSNPEVMAADLRLPKEPKDVACAFAAIHRVPYLIQLRYIDGVVWIAHATGQCSGPTNGRFTAAGNIAEDAALSFDEGTWTNAAPHGPCSVNIGREGQERQIVPDTPTSAVYCSQDGKTVLPINHPEDLPRLLSILNKPAAHESSGFCTGGPSRSVQLIFRYAEGRSVSVVVMNGCTDAGNTSNRSLVTTLSPQDLEDVFRFVA